MAGHGKRYQDAAKLVDHTRVYRFNRAVKGMQLINFKPIKVAVGFKGRTVAQGIEHFSLRRRQFRRSQFKQNFLWFD